MLDENPLAIGREQANPDAGTLPLPKESSLKIVNHFAILDRVPRLVLFLFHDLVSGLGNVGYELVIDVLAGLKRNGDHSRATAQTCLTSGPSGGCSVRETSLSCAVAAAISSNGDRQRKNKAFLIVRAASVPMADPPGPRRMARWLSEWSSWADLAIKLA